MPLTTNQADFPIGFAEDSKNNEHEGSVSYVEWLKNDAEFPDLTTKDATVVEKNWEVLEQKQVEQEDFTIVQERDNWTKINALNMHTYVEIAEKNANELKPTKRRVQPLWPEQDKFQVVHSKEENDNDGIDMETIYDTHKSQAKLAIRSTHLRRMHDLKVLDPVLPGIYDMGTAKTKDRVVLGDQEKGADIPSYKCKADALRDASTKNFTRFKWIVRADPSDEKRHKVDDREYTVLDSNRKRDHNIIE